MTTINIFGILNYKKYSQERQFLLSYVKEKLTNSDECKHGSYSAIIQQVELNNVKTEVSKSQKIYKLGSQIDMYNVYQSFYNIYNDNKSFFVSLPVDNNLKCDDISDYLNFLANTPNDDDQYNVLFLDSYPSCLNFTWHKIKVWL